MTTPSPIRPTRWGHDELERDRAEARAEFVRAWSARPAIYAEAYREAEPVVRRLFEASADLSDLFVAADDLAQVVEAAPETDVTGANIFVAHPDLVTPARFLAAPPVSEDYLTGLLGRRPGRRIGADLANDIIAILNLAWDPIRFPWLQECRVPDGAEREGAIRWTAGLWAVERSRTRTRNSSSNVQEAAVRSMLYEVGYLSASIPSNRNIMLINDLTEGSYTSGEVTLDSEKCDVLVRLRDGRLLAMECKVSNTAINSHKRLVRETGGKAIRWRGAFGDRNLMTVAVLAGVFTLSNLIRAQDDFGMAIVWQHNLDPLRTFISAIG